MRNSRALLALMLVAAAGGAHVVVRAQGSVSQNINVITGTSDQFIGDEFRQRDNEAVLGISSVNPSHMMAAFNTYRTVDFVDPDPDLPPSPIQGTFARFLDFLHLPWRRPAPPPVKGKGMHPMMAAAQAWMGLSFSDDGGINWYSGLHPGRAGMPPPIGADPAFGDESSSLSQYEAMSDPVMASTHNQFFVGGIAFTPGGFSVGFVSRLTDDNSTESGRNIQFDGTKILVTQPARFFVDKPSIAAAIGPNGQTYVYAAFVIFDEKDPKKLSSKVVVYRSTNAGLTWSQQPVTISQPLTRNQSPWIVVDPNNPLNVYVGWRVFAAQTGGIANAIVGKRSRNGGASFEPSFPYPVALLLKAFDQPQGNLLGLPPTLPSPRSNAYPSAAIDGNGGIHVAMQEYVNPSTGVPLSPFASPATGVPRVTITSSYNQGLTWTPRRAIDFGPGSGTQFVPVVAAVGEPGPSCPGRNGPRSRVMVMYYDARASGVGVKPSLGFGIVAGGEKQFDVRIAEASACNRDGIGRLIFGPSQQMSRYTLSATPNQQGQYEIVKRAGHGYTSVNRPYPMFCGGGCSFSGDYLHLIPRVPYVQVGASWRPTTAAGVNQSALPAPIVKGVWADTRDVLLPGADPSVDPSLNPPLPPLVSIDSLPWSIYDPPGTGKLSCLNPGSRDQNVYSADYTPGVLFAAAPETFRVSNIPRAYPVYVENRSAQLRLVKLTIAASAVASFDYTTFDKSSANFGQHKRVADIAIGPHSTVTGSIVVGPGVATSVLITIAEINANGALLANGARTSVTLFTGGLAAATPTETHVPAVTVDPIVTKPFPPGTFPVTNTTSTPFTQNPFTQNPFSQNPFSQNPFSQNPFTQNPFTQNPFAQNTTIHDVTDVSFQVTNEGTHAAAFSAILNLQKNVAPGSYFFQVLITRTTILPGLSGATGCQSVDRPQDVQISSILNPFAQNPFSQNPFSQNPFSQNPFSQNPFSQNPFTQNPFSQNTSPEDIEVSNSTFYIAPMGSGAQTLAALNVPGPDYRAERAIDQVIYTLRMFRMFEIQPGQPPNFSVIDPFSDVGVTVTADTPDINADGTFAAGRNTDGGGAANPVIITQTLPAAIQNTPYSQSLTANGGISPYVWSLDAIGGYTLPPGLTLSPGGVISGTPTTVGLFTFRVRVTDSLGHFDTADLCINVETAFAGTLSATAAPDTAPETINAIAQTLVGSGVTISNVQYTGVAAAIGTFAGAANIGLNSGIMLSSGGVTNMNGINDATATTLVTGQPGDVDLNARIPPTTPIGDCIPGSRTCDAAGLEFDFVPDGPIVSFQYVFASEEYNEYVNTQFNDVFAFLISGPGILADPNSDKKNFALVPGPVPGSMSPVSINTVNNGELNDGVNATNPQLFVNNVGGPIQTQADGLTKVLTLQASVIPGQTYHMKLAIADAGDPNLDSWVLIKANSLVACTIIEEP